MVLEDFLASALAIMFGLYPTSSIIFSTRSRHFFPTFPCALTTLDTVAVETPAIFATSLSVTKLFSLKMNYENNYLVINWLQLSLNTRKSTKLYTTVNPT
jgi:hypothetical protein